MWYGANYDIHRRSVRMCSVMNPEKVSALWMQASHLEFRMWPCACSPASLRGFLISPLVEVIIQMAIPEMQLSDSWWSLSPWRRNAHHTPLLSTFFSWRAPNRYPLWQPLLDCHLSSLGQKTYYVSRLADCNLFKKIAGIFQQSRAAVEQRPQFSIFYSDFWSGSKKDLI